VSNRTVITFGTFDVFHVGHVRVLQRAAALGDRLVVGVSADALNIAKKGRPPVFTQDERIEIVSALRVVDEVFVEESLELKRDYILTHGADVLVMGDDWTGKFDWVGDVCEVVYLPRTPSVSTTGLIEHIAGLG
jgi:glycerol-3-phosphate cytidylyltransferase